MIRAMSTLTRAFESQQQVYALDLYQLRHSMISMLLGVISFAIKSFIVRKMVMFLLCLANYIANRNGCSWANDKMKYCSHNSPQIVQLTERISPYTREAIAHKMPYWIFLEDDVPIGILISGKEPVRLIAKRGTPMALLYLIDTEAEVATVDEFIKEALTLAGKMKCKYVTTTIRSNYDTIKRPLLKAGFQMLDDSNQMLHRLESDIESSDELVFTQVDRDGLCEYIAFAAEFLQDSPDVMLSTAIRHMLDVSDDFLDVHHSQMKSFIVRKDNEPVGILEFSTESGLIGVVGVKRDHRGKGYGREMVSFGLKKLIEARCKQAYLRVHANNAAAIALYKSIGFDIVDNFQSLIWWSE